MKNASEVTIPVSDVFWAGTFFPPGSVVESETIIMIRQG
jgi:hypothetical protein